MIEICAISYSNLLNEIKNECGLILGKHVFFETFERKVDSFLGSPYNSVLFSLIDLNSFNIPLIVDACYKRNKTDLNPLFHEIIQTLKAYIIEVVEMMSKKL